MEEHKMNFYGIIESNEIWMCGLPIMGVASDERWPVIIGQITGNMKDMYDYHLGVGFREGDFYRFIRTTLQPGKIPPEYKFTECTYKEACKRMLFEYEWNIPSEYQIKTAAGLVLIFDMSKIIENLKKAIADDNET